MPDTPLLARIRSLQEKHETLERRIQEEEVRPRPDPDEIHRLKREKLRLRDEIERLRNSS
ncbi:MAG: YdcH family protein [Acetobacteraceae bacterium]|nr:YdcH family protein [Acetobacteraceae bacterium]